jgi:hypothetical protein
MQELKEMVQDQSYVYIVTMLFPPRPGGMLFSTKLEYEHYRPLTPANRDFVPLKIRWPEDEEMHWWVIRIPAKDFAIAKTVAAECPIKMRIADGIPHILGGPHGVRRFPLDGPNVFSLENAEPVGAVQSLLEKEKAEVEKLWKVQQKWLLDNGFEKEADENYEPDNPIIGTPSLILLATAQSFELMRADDVKMMMVGDHQRAMKVLEQYLSSTSNPQIDDFLMALYDAKGFRVAEVGDVQNTKLPIMFIPWGSHERHWSYLKTKKRR